MSYFDLQVNGYAGVDFCASRLSAERMREACEALRADGIDEILATIITDSIDSLVDKLRNLVRLREEDDLVREVVRGFHVEGPFISSKAGYVGAHPVGEVVPATPEAAARLIDAGEGLVRLVTLAPECDEDCATTRYLADSGVAVSAGHCDPSLDRMERAIDAGLSMVTHLGNGCPVDLPRHDNIIQRCLALSDRLWIGFIPDGAHVPFFALTNYIRLVGVERTIVTTDAIMAAGLGPGRYELSGAPVEIDADGVARRPGSANLAGSTIRGHQVAANLRTRLGFGDPEIRALFHDNPKRALAL